jgi:5-deoxy-glucuronate isomerase
MADDYIVHPQPLPAGQSGLLIDFPRERARWEWMSFFVRRLAPGDEYRAGSATEETALILLGGRCRADWGEGPTEVGERANVFDGLPYALYLPAASNASVEAITTCEFAECRVPSSAKHNPRLITPDDVQVSLRGGGNASRQIVDVVPPSFPADRIIAVEVYTPAGNWSSYPPHKHDVHNPPTEVDLDEIYYYRMQRPEGYAHQRLYKTDGSRDLVVTAHDGDAVLIRDGYHPVVAGHGYNCYYLNFIAGSARSLANTIDPEHAWVMQTWKEFSPGLPMVERAKAGAHK